MEGQKEREMAGGGNGAQGQQGPRRGQSVSHLHTAGLSALQPTKVVCVFTVWLDLNGGIRFRTTVKDCSCTDGLVQFCLRLHIGDARRRSRQTIT